MSSWKRQMRNWIHRAGSIIAAISTIYQRFSSWSSAACGMKSSCLLFQRKSLHSTPSSTSHKKTVSEINFWLERDKKMNSNPLQLFTTSSNQKSFQLQQYGRCYKKVKQRNEGSWWMAGTYEYSKQSNYQICLCAEQPTASSTGWQDWPSFGWNIYAQRRHCSI